MVVAYWSWCGARGSKTKKLRNPKKIFRRRKPLVLDEREAKVERKRKSSILKIREKNMERSSSFQGTASEPYSDKFGSQLMFILWINAYTIKPVYL